MRRGLLSDSIDRMTNEIEPEAVNPLTPETFSFFDVLSGDEYPKDSVEIFLDETSAHKLNKVLDKIQRAAPDDDIEDLVTEAGRLHMKVEQSMHTFYITGVSDDVIADLREVAEGHFEDKKKPEKTADGRLTRRLPESEQMNYVRYFNALVMSVHIEQVVNARGQINTAPDVDEVALLISKAPVSQKEKLGNAIAGLRVKASEFEASIDADFLAKP